ncbi:phytanoyl-CoA dioxygenase family protein [Novosphingobium sp. ST904]|nr:phytanoyl-CoA dioxygenase family protein [Novosphingobium sp. ST904]
MAGWLRRSSMRLPGFWRNGRTAGPEPGSREMPDWRGCSGRKRRSARLAELAGLPVRPVRAVLFDKNDRADWSLGWHQDRTIAVRAEADLPGFGPWTVKQGICHVEPPFALIEGMLTVRIHLDPVDAGNAPLLIVPGSHRLGRIAVADVDAIVARAPVFSCLADTGDVWIYRTPILHASHAARPGRRRRVLQVDYAAGDLPAPLEWLGI